MTLPDRSALTEALQIAQLVPEAHAAYRPLLADGLQFFLERLPPTRLAHLFAEQLNLPQAATSARRLGHPAPPMPDLTQTGTGGGARSATGARTA